MGLFEDLFGSPSTDLLDTLNVPFYVAPQIGLVAVAVGDYGSAKTEIIYQLGAITNRRVLPYELTQHLPEDIAGYPSLAQATFGNGKHKQTETVTRKAKPEDLVRAKYEPSIIYLDELSNVSRQRQAAALSLMASPPANAWVYASGNPMDVSVDGYELAPPTVNRLFFTKWLPPLSSWIDGMHNGGQFPVPELPVVKQDQLLNQLIHICSEMFASFFQDQLRDHGNENIYSALLKQTTAGNEASCTLRSMYNASRLLAGLARVGAKETDYLTALRGTIGDVAAEIFYEWVGINNIDFSSLDENQLNALPKYIVAAFIAQQIRAGKSAKVMDSLREPLLNSKYSDLVTFLPTEKKAEAHA